jgi:hypothetical protein
MVYDPHLGYEVDAEGNPLETKRERLIDPRNRPAPKPPEPKRPWDDARRAALLLEIRRSVKHFKPDPSSEWHKANPDISRDELARALCDLLTKELTDSQLECHLRGAWLMAHRPICQLLSFRRRM